MRGCVLRQAAQAQDTGACGRGGGRCGGVQGQGWGQGHEASYEPAGGGLGSARSYRLG